MEFNILKSMTLPSPGIRLLLWGLVWTCACCWGGMGVAQEVEMPPFTPMPAEQPFPQTPAEDNKSPAPETLPPVGPTLPPSQPMPSEAVPTQSPYDILYLPDEEGKLKPVPVNTTLEQYLDWLDQRDEEEEGTTQPQWMIRNLDAQGTLKTSANGELWANIRCQMILEVASSNRWQSLPLMMGEGLLAGVSEAEPVDGSRLMVTRDTDSGQWLLWYRERKSFTLTANILVPVRVNGETNQLVLTLPAASRTEMQLQLDRKDLTVDLQSRGFWEKEANEEGLLIRVAGFQQNLDVRWTPNQQDQEMPPIMHVDSQIEVSRSNESSLITARQKINLDRGVLSTMRVKLPQGYQVDEVISDQTMKYVIEATDPSSITLNFKQPVQTSVQIDWKLSAPIRRFESQMMLDGFRVEGARTQTGKIGVVKSNEWRIGQIPDRSENVYIMNVREFPMPGEYSQAYRYYGQPYRLMLNTQRMESQYTQEAFYRLHADRDLLKLQVDFEVTPRNGVLDAIRLDWPQLNSGVWTPEKITQQSTGLPIEYLIEGDDKLLLPLPNIDQKEIIHLEATRRIPNLAGLIDNSQTLPITLPYISMSETIPQDRVLQLTTSRLQPWEINLVAEEAQFVASKNVPEDWLNKPLFQRQKEAELRQNWYRLASSIEPLSLQFRKIRPYVECRNQIQLLKIDLENKRILYDQQFRFNFLNLPAEKISLVQQPFGDKDFLLTQIVMSDALGNELIPEVTDYESDEVVELPRNEVPLSQQVGYRFTFQPPIPVLGEYVVRVRRSVPITAESVQAIQTLNLPLLQAEGGDRIQTNFQNQSAYLVELAEQNWRMTEFTSKDQIWQTSEHRSQLNLQANFHRSRLAEDVGFVETQIESWLSGEGLLVSKIQFEIAKTPPAFILKQSLDSEFISAYWRPESDNTIYTLEFQKRAEELTISLPELAIGQPGRLVVALRQKRPQSLFSLQRFHLRLPEHSLEQDVALLDWRVHLPKGVYLFSSPAGFRTHSHWTWTGLGFRRELNSTSGQETAFPWDQTLGDQHPVYEFSSVGWVTQMTPRFIGRGLLMTLGTGLPILIAVLFAGRTYEQRLRGGLLLILGLGAFAVLFPEPFAVLLQPALLGTLFVLIATWVAGQMRRRQEEPTLIIVGPGMQAEPGNQEPVRLSDLGVGADDVTRIHPPRRSTVESSHP